MADGVLASVQSIDGTESEALPTLATAPIQNCRLLYRRNPDGTGFFPNSQRRGEHKSKTWRGTLHKYL